MNSAEDSLALQEEYVTAELVLATLLETARLGDSGPATVAANARRRVDTPGAGGQIPGDTPWQPGKGGATPTPLQYLSSIKIPLLTVWGVRTQRLAGPRNV